MRVGRVSLQKDSGVTQRAEVTNGRRFGRLFAERHIFIKSDAGTRFVRLKPRHTMLALLAGTALVGWSLAASSVLVLDLVQGESARHQALHDQAIYEERLSELGAERDALRAAAREAQSGFDAALSEFAAFQDRLANADRTIRELDGSAEALRRILATTMAQRDAAEAKLASLIETTGASDIAALERRQAEADATMGFLTRALARTATERTREAAGAASAQAALADAEFNLAVLEEANARIFGQLEEAMVLAMEPMEGMFESVGIEPADILAQMRRQYSGQGGPLTPVAVSASNRADPDGARANAILAQMDELNLYRIASHKVPFALPVAEKVRFTSGFGYRRDPFGRGTRFHSGVDWAGAHGTPILASADGVVTFAGWQSGYGRLIKISHDFGIETRFAHLAKFDVKVGQKVSRGQKIGAMGSSGRSTGTHLHYEVRVGGTPVNPMSFIQAARDVF